MRKVIIAIVGLGILSIAAPFSSANAEDAVVIKKDHDHDRDWHRHHKKVVIIKHHHHDHDHDHD